MLFNIIWLFPWINPLLKICLGSFILDKHYFRVISPLIAPSNKYFNDRMWFKATYGTFHCIQVFWLRVIFTLFSCKQCSGSIIRTFFVLSYIEFVCELHVFAPSQCDTKFTFISKSGMVTSPRSVFERQFIYATVKKIVLTVYVLLTRYDWR